MWNCMEWLFYIGVNPNSETNILCAILKLQPNWTATAIELQLHFKYNCIFNIFLKILNELKSTWADELFMHRFALCKS